MNETPNNIADPIGSRNIMQSRIQIHANDSRIGRRTYNIRETARILALFTGQKEYILRLEVYRAATRANMEHTVIATTFKGDISISVAPQEEAAAGTVSSETLDSKIPSAIVRTPI